MADDKSDKSCGTCSHHKYLQKHNVHICNKWGNPIRDQQLNFKEGDDCYYYDEKTEAKTT